jgi:hypothetical protein
LMSNVGVVVEVQVSGVMLNCSSMYSRLAAPPFHCRRVVSNWLRESGSEFIFSSSSVSQPRQCRD